MKTTIDEPMNGGTLRSNFIYYNFQERENDYRHIQCCSGIGNDEFVEGVCLDYLAVSAFRP